MKAIELWTYVGFFIAICSFLQKIVPYGYFDNFTQVWKDWLNSQKGYHRLNIREYDSGTSNELYEAVNVYLSNLTISSAQSLFATQVKNTKSVVFSLANEQRISDVFDGAKVEWEHCSFERTHTIYTSDDASSDEKRSFHLQVLRVDKDRITDRYLQYITAKASDLRRSINRLLLYTNQKHSKKHWSSVPFLHPANFDTLGIEPELKFRIIADLDRFAHAEGFYQRVGKVWKRGYLLYGPPGTGKSSMIAAIANKMRYDIYNLELTEVESNNDLIRLLMHTTPKSIIVIEDIDCSLDLAGQRKKKTQEKEKESSRFNDPSRVTLSGLLNFTDGLSSAFVAERIFIFTSNHVKYLDPALLRAGRMDMHINLSYCTFPAFKVLGKSYLELDDHPLYCEVESQLITGSFITPAQVTEIFLRHDCDPDLSLQTLVEELGLLKYRSPLKCLDSETEEEAEPEGVMVEAGNSD